MADREKVISGLQYTIEMFLFDPATGHSKDPDDLNDADRITYDACIGAIALLKEQETANLYKCPNCGTWVSAENVVRCKDCKHATMTADGKMCKYCAMDADDFGDQRDVYHDANWFCADGERR